jgi:hypothetical protein
VPYDSAKELSFFKRLKRAAEIGLRCILPLQIKITFFIRKSISLLADTTNCAMIK